MKKSLFRPLLPLLAIIITLGACTTTESPQTEYTHVIPANVTQIAAIDSKTLVEKMGMSETDRQQIISLLMDNYNLSSPKFTDMLSNPIEAGIDWNVPLFLFQAPSLRSAAITAKIADLTKFETLINALVEQGLCTTPQKAEGYYSIELKESGIQLSYNNGTLLAVYGGNSTQLKKLQPAIDELMKQTAEQSIRTNEHFSEMLKQKGDIRLLATPDLLPMSIRGILNWAHGTQLSGYLLFENGRIYATLQRAGFNGKTGENNQPFHPSNSRELQQALLGAMHGKPFNISLTSEELLTLSNLHILMELAPNTPIVNPLYQAIMQIEELNLRGDNNQTRFTLILHEKNQNALKQLIDLAKQLATL